MDDTMDDIKLVALLAVEAPPAADPRFVVAVMARIEQRRFRHELAVTAGLALGAMVLAGLVTPSLETVWRDSFAPFASNVTIALVLASITLAAPYFFPARID